MSSKAPYISEEYRHLITYSKPQPGSNISHNQPVYFHPPPSHQYPTHNQHPTQQYFIQQQQIHQQPIVFLPSVSQNLIYPQTRQSDESYAADQPNPQYPSINSYEKSYFGNSHNQDLTTKSPEQQKQVIHKIQYGDTLQGLSLIYDTSISKIKQRNNIQGDSIYYLKQLIIPNPRASPLQSVKTQQMLIEQFMGYMPADERSDKTARFYLNDNDWQMDSAVKAFKGDLEWERKNRIQYNAVKVNKYGSKVNYQEQELLIKKGM